MKNIYLFGECMIELMKTTPDTMRQSFAGDVFNTAVYLKRTFADVNVHLVTAVGQDEFSAGMIQFFESEHIGTDNVFKSEDKIPGLYSIQLDDEGERSFTYWRSDSAARQVMKHINEKITETLSQGDMFFFSGISLAVITPEDRDKFWLFVSKLKRAGVTLVFDPNYRARLWDNPEQAKTQFEQAFKYSDILLPGVDDFEQLYGLKTSEDVFSFCKPYEFEELVIKNGEKGIFCYSGEQVYHFNIDPVKNVVDTTSAGDSFNGVYIGARAKGLNFSHSVESASKAAGLVIQHRGAIVNSKVYADFVAQQFG